jgi:tetratricopeptide (TPR) repeat protein
MFRFIIVLLAFAVAGCSVNKDVYNAASGDALKAGSHDEAVLQYESSVKKNVHSHYYYAGLGDIHYGFGRYAEAVNDYTRAIRNSGMAEFHMKRGRAYMGLGIYRDAAIDFSTVIEKAGVKMPEAYVERAKAHAAEGDFAGALKDLEKAQKRGGEGAEFLKAVAELNFRMERYADAKANVQKAIAVNNADSDLYLLRAKIFYKSMDANQTIEDLKTAISINPSNSEAKSMLAWIYATNPLSAYRNGAEAVRLAKELFDRDKDVRYVEVLAAAYAQTGDFSSAISTLKEGMRLTQDLVQREDFRFDISIYEKGELIRSW